MKSKSIAKLKQEAAKLLQKLVRLKAAVANGSENITCVDCGKPGHWKYDFDGGHFYSRRHHSTLLIEENVHPQHKGCNRLMGFGDTVVYENYRKYMVNMYGEEFIEELGRIAKTPKKYTKGELEDLISEWGSLVKELESQV